MMLAWVIVGVLPVAPLAIILAKEGLLVLGSILMLKKKIVVFSAKAGKYAQLVMVVGLALCYFHEHLPYPFHVYLVWIAAALSLWALYFYIDRAIRFIREKEAETQKQ